jgi:tRNA threonylcarbamoyladenosine biosynthesis protein TsaB|tara:strand:+ start:288 stop:953 length:666 start_codon:yes stop_codon:yes gene_type:complete
MSYILSIETATKSCSIALAKDGQLIDCFEEVSEKYSHSEQLTVFIQDILAKHHLSTKDLEAIAISSGPGSYTGLRIGVSTAKGLCYALDIPLISISTLEAMAQLMVEDYPDFILCPMIDARRMEVYCAFFGKQQSPVSAKVIDADSFAKELEQSKILFFGDGADKCQDTLTQPNAHFELGIYPSARGMLKLAYTKFANKEFEDVAYYEPFYLKEFVAGVKK